MKRTAPPSLLLGAIIALSAAVFLPALRAEFWPGDEYYMLALLQGVDPSPESSRWDLYHFNNPASVKVLMDHGFVPWWTDPAQKMSFWRPLASALLVLDHRLFGLNPVGYHLHSLLWWLALAIAAAALFRRVLPGPTGVLASALFAGSWAHFFPVARVCNRHALIAALCGVLALLAHVRFRAEGWKPGRLLALVAIAVGLLASELVVLLAAYLLAFELIGTPRDTRARVLALLPVSALVVAHALLHRFQGYGVARVFDYADPLREPERYLRFLPETLAWITSQQLLGPNPWLSGPALFGAAALAAIVVGLPLRAALQHLPAEESRAVRWLLLGAALIALPAASVLPTHRMLLPTSLGAAAAIAAILRHAWNRLRQGPADRPAARWATLGAASALFASHALFQPLLTVGASLDLSRRTARSTSLLRDKIALDPRATEVVVLNAAPELALVTAAPMLRALGAAPEMRSWRLLSVIPDEHEIVRTGPGSLELRVKGGSLGRTLSERYFRREDFPLQAPEEIALRDVHVRVLASSSDGPTRVAFHFARPLDDPSYCILSYRDGALRPVALPPINASITIPEVRHD